MRKRRKFTIEVSVFVKLMYYTFTYELNVEVMDFPTFLSVGDIKNAFFFCYCVRYDNLQSLFFINFTYLQPVYIQSSFHTIHFFDS